jgi:hypothetical protein
MTIEISKGWKRGLILGLVIWSVGLIVPELARVPNNYGTLGFEANNDGVIIAVDGPPATDPNVHLKRGDCIDLHRTALPDRLAVFGSMGGMTYVRPDLQVTLYVADDSCDNSLERSTRRVLTAHQEPMSAANGIVLAATQILGVFFIGLAAVLVWQRPSAMTWGFFLYAIWFNPGQWFVSYAELQRHWYWLIPQQVLQTIAQAIGYAGFVSFALRFPHNDVEPRWQPVERMLPALVAVLIVLQLLSFGTAFGFRTESVSRWNYWAGYAIDIAVLIILYERRKTQAPEDQQRTRWVHWGCWVGLTAFIFADSNMATGAWTPLWDSVCPTWLGALICTGGSPSETFLLFCFLLNANLALAVFHAVRHHRVIDLRLALSRGAVLFVTSFIIAALLATASLPIEETLHESFASQVFVYVPLFALLKMTFDRLHDWLKERCDRLFFKRLHVAEERLKHVAANLINATTEDAIEQQLVDEPVRVLNLASAAIFRSDADGSYHRTSHSFGWSSDTAATIPFRKSLLDKLAQGTRPVWLGSQDIDVLMPQGAAQPVIAVPVGAGELRAIALYGARATGDNLTEDESQLLEILATAAGRAFDRVESLSLRNKLSALQAVSHPA